MCTIRTEEQDLGSEPIRGHDWSGPGAIALGFAEILSPGEVVGLDTSAYHVEAARHAAQERGIRNARFDVGDIYHLPFPNGTFDAAFSSAVLQYLHDPIAALQEMRRVLKPGGIVGVRNATPRTRQPGIGGVC